MVDTKPHSSIHGGLRGHTIGSFYPFSVYYKGTNESGSYCIMNAIDSEFKHITGLSCKVAHETAQKLYNDRYL